MLGVVRKLRASVTSASHNTNPLAAPTAPTAPAAPDVPVPTPCSRTFPLPFHVENLFGSQTLVNPELTPQLNMAFVKKRHILLADVRAEETG